MKRGLFLALLLAVAGCGEEGSYGLQVVFPDEESIGATSRLIVWVLDPGGGSCDRLETGELDPEDMTERARLVVSDPQEGASELKLQDVPDGRLLFFVEGQTEAGGKILRGCEDVRVSSGAKQVVTITLAWVCHPSPQGEIAGNGEDDDCDGLTDECNSDLDCNDGNGCTSDICTASECHNSPFPNGLQCSDGDACTQDDACLNGVCTGTGKDCTAYDGLCKVGRCNPDTGECGSEPVEDLTACDDGLYCTTGDSCQGGLCAGSGLDCDDQDECTVDSCNDVSDSCENMLEPRPGEEGPVGDATCTDGADNDCDGTTDGLDPNCMGCMQDAECDDGNQCTDDSCAAPDCINTPVTDGTACDDGLWCTDPEACSGGVCGGPARGCSGMADACHDGVCVEENDACEAREKSDGADCDDGQYCTDPDHCTGGVCGGPGRGCEDADTCTLDTCDETNGVCNHVLQPVPGAEGPPGDPTCGNGVDDDCDGRTDNEDIDCLARVKYRSVGTNPADLNVDAASLEISGNTATFSLPLPDQVGVGDVLQYRVEGTWHVAFIHGRRSDRVYSVRNAAGDAPGQAQPGTAAGVYRAYTSLARWEAQNENDSLNDGVENFDTSTDLVADNAVMYAACYGDSADATPVVVEGWATGPDNYITIFTPVHAHEVGISQRHDGKWSNSAYRLEYGGGGSQYSTLHVRIGYVRIDGLQVSITAHHDGNHGISMGSGDGEFWLSNTIIKGIAAVDVDGFSGLQVYYTSGGGSVVRVWNNIMYGFDYAGTSNFMGCLYINPSSARGWVYNNTVYHCKNGVAGRLADKVVLNNVAINCVNGYLSWDGDNPDTDYNTTDSPGHFPGPNSRNGTDGEVTFVDEAGEDFHLDAADTGARDHGVDLSNDPDLPFSDDIDGDARSPAWDMGADEF